MARSKRIVDTNSKPANISVVSTEDFKEAVVEAGKLRDHTLSEACDEILRLGFPHYQRKFKPKYQHVEQAA